MKVVLIGSGNVATQLGIALQKSKHKIVQVFGRNISSTKTLSKKLSCDYTTHINSISGEADIYIIALRDEAIKPFLGKFSSTDKLVVHTSGSIPLKVFGRKFKNCGVLYPVQTFSVERKIDFKNIPVCIEAGNDVSKRKIVQLVKTITTETHFINSEKRKKIHLAAVFANNFTNHLFSIAENILSGEKLSFDLIRPIILETALKVQSASPIKMQTGPAKRGDKAVIKEHLKMLKDKRKFQRIYKLITESILKY